MYGSCNSFISGSFDFFSNNAYPHSDASGSQFGPVCPPSLILRLGVQRKIKKMPKLSLETKERINTVTSVAKFTFRWGYIPLVLYLGLFLFLFVCVL